MVAVALASSALWMVLFSLAYAFADIPDPDDVGTAQAVIVVDHQGRRLGTISGGENRVSIPFEEMPEHLRNAVVAIEDRTFYRHSGIAPLSLLRAAWRNIRERAAVEGGSTITQQYVKNAFVGTERSLTRKIREAILAVKLDRSWSKDEILAAYLNTIYLGRGAYGIEAAARTYFDVKARSLNLAQSALLAAMIVAPEDLDPSRNMAEARARRNLVLDRMAAQGYLEPARAARAARTAVRVEPRRVGGPAPHLFEDVRKLLEREIGPRALYRGGVTVQVTLDRGMQRAAERAVRQVYDRRSDPQAALVAIEPGTGAVRAMVGGRDFGRLQFNLATQARRQPGSTFKTAVLAAAVEEGMSTQQRFRAPGTITIDAEPPWRVSNYDHRDHGRLSVARATELSVNTVYAQMIDQIGPEAVADAAARLGIETDLQEVLSLALGTSEVSVLELTSLYATLGARGEWFEPAMVLRVTDADGTVLFEPEPASARAVDTDVADRVNAVLQGVVQRGTGRSAQIGRPAAGKTGTTENFRDALFAGYTPDLAAVVWNGYPKGTKTLKDVRGIDVTGGSFPAAIWRAFMTDALADVPPTPFTDPAPEGDDEPSPTPSESGAAPSPTLTPSRSPSPTTSPSPTAVPSTPPPPSPAPTRSPSPTASPAASPSPSQAEP